MAGQNSLGTRISVFLPLLVLVVVIVTAPALVVADQHLVLAALTLAASCGITAIGLAMGAEDARRILALLAPALLVCAVPLAWMFIQALPLQPLGLSHPIWESAQSALGRSLNGSISIDPGATLLAACSVLSALALLTLALATSIRREGAALLLTVLAAVAGVSAVLYLGDHCLRSLNIGSLPLPELPAAINAFAFGGIINAAAALRALEIWETRVAGRPKPPYRRLVPVLPWLLGSVLCASELALQPGRQELFAAACGVSMLALITTSRRIVRGLSLQLTCIIWLVLCISFAIASWPAARATDVSLALARASPASIAAARLLLPDRTWSGAGAGTYAAVLRMYGGPRQATQDLPPPTTALALTIEMGKCAVLAATGLSAILVLTLAYGSVRRRKGFILPCRCSELHRRGCCAVLRQRGPAELVWRNCPRGCHRAGLGAAGRTTHQTAVSLRHRRARSA